MKVDVSQFLRSWDRISEEVPRAVIEGFAKVAARGRDNARIRTRSAFQLHSNYITNGIRSIPGTKGTKGADRQAAAALKGLLGRHHNFRAAVFIRGSRSAKKSLEFMADHEFGGERKPHGGNRALALPRKELKSKSFRTARGRVKRRYKPEMVIKKIKAQDLKPRKRKWGRHRKPRPFLVTFKSGRRGIAVRADKTKRLPLNFLYEFQEGATIRESYRFAEIVYQTTARNLKLIIAELEKVR